MKFKPNLVGPTPLACGGTILVATGSAAEKRHRFTGIESNPSIDPQRLSIYPFKSQATFAALTVPLGGRRGRGT